jgi:hypothetical protein
MSEQESRESLEKLEEEERMVSTRRRRLHDKIEFLKTTGVDEPDVAERLEKVEEEEREVSQRRRELHAQIDALRKELGIEPGPPARERGLGG